MTIEDLLNYYYRSDTIVFDGRKPALLFNPQHLLGAKVGSDIRDPKTNDLIVKEGKKFTRPVLRQMESARIKHVPIAWEEILGRVAAHDIVNPQAKEVLVECNQEITQEKLELIRERGIHQIEVLFIDDSNVGPYLRNTLLQDKIRSPRMRSSRSTAGSDLEIRLRSNPRLTSLTIFSSIRIATICRK